jgi:serine/threonine-protein kinase
MSGTKVRPVEAVTEVNCTDVVRSARSATAEAPLCIGSEVGDYVVEAVLGEGGNGLVYAVADRAMQRRLAMKVLRPELSASPVMLTRFVREAEAIRRIGHPNVVTIHEFGELAPGRPYYVMELLEGRDLKAHLEANGRLSPEAVLELLEPICRAVQAAHDVGIVHRDIKASNVFIAEQAGQRVVKLLDFGIAKSLSGNEAQGLTEPGARLGTAHNMAPEQVRGEPVDARTDIYALGVLLHQLLTGRHPFVASEPHEVALLHLEAPAPRPSALAPGAAALDALVLRCLEKQPERRFRSPGDLLLALTRAVRGQPVSGDRALAVGIYFEASAVGEPPDDESFEEMASALDRLEQELESAGFVPALRTSDGALAVRPLEDATRSAEARAGAERLARALLVQLAVETQVKLVASVHVDELSCQQLEGKLELTGGALLKVRSWASLHVIGG